MRASPVTHQGRCPWTLLFAFVFTGFGLVFAFFPRASSAEGAAPTALRAGIELYDSEMRVTFPPDLQERIIAESWDVLALIYKSHEQPPTKTAYVLQSDGETYRLSAAYPKQAYWTLELILSPSKGERIIGTFSFFDRELVK